MMTRILTVILRLNPTLNHRDAHFIVDIDVNLDAPALRQIILGNGGQLSRNNVGGAYVVLPESSQNVGSDNDIDWDAV